MSSFRASSRKTVFFYAALISIVSVVVGMVLASRLDLQSQSSAQTIAVPPMNSAPLSGPVDAMTFKNIAKAQSPMVVNVRTESRQRTQDLSDFFGGQGDMFERFFGQPGQPGQQGQGQRPRQQPREQLTQAAGTGFIISRDGFILTNNHVVEGASKIEVQFFGDEDTYYEAKVVGRDPLTDSALIQLVEKPDRPLQEAKFGDSSQMEPGDWVMAIGNPFGLAHTVSVGVISASSRAFPVSEGRTQNVLQTDAAINPGNSGGPLLNIRGEVVGINTAIYSNDRQSGNIGIGFAIPINVVRERCPVCGSARPRAAAWRVGHAGDRRHRRGALGLGATWRPGRVGGSGGAAASWSPARRCHRGIQWQTDFAERRLVQAGVATRPGSVVPLKVVRSGKDVSLNVKVEELNLESETSQQAERNDTPEQSGGGFGITLNNLTPDVARRMEVPNGTEGAVVTDVEPDSPAARVLQAGDIILSVNRREVSSAADASRALQAVASGRPVGLLILRRGQQRFVTVRKPYRPAPAIVDELRAVIAGRISRRVRSALRHMDLALYHPTRLLRPRGPTDGRAGDFYQRRRRASLR